MSPIRWVPLEANPEVLNGFARKIGVRDPNFAFQDVFGLDPELLGFVPSPVLAVILLYPLTATSEAERLAELARQPETDRDAIPADLFYMKQTIGNACGTIAMLHCLANVSCLAKEEDGAGARAQDTAPVSAAGMATRVARQGGGILDRFLAETAEMTPEAIGAYLEEGRGCSEALHGLHGEAAQGGETTAPGVDDEINLHFVAFVEKGGLLWELDGRRAGPVQRGPVEDGVMESVARVVKEVYIEGGGGDIHFNLIALAGTCT